MVAPHGTLDRLEAGDCYCAWCVDAAVEDGPYDRVRQRVLVDLDTGRVIDHARVVSTRYGARWVVDRDPDGDGYGDADWYPVSPKRRSTLANKGVIEAEAVFLVRRSSRRDTYFPIARIESPDVDDWGEAIPTP